MAAGVALPTPAVVTGTLSVEVAEVSPSPVGTTEGACLPGGTQSSAEDAVVGGQAFAATVLVATFEVALPTFEFGAALGTAAAVAVVDAGAAGAALATVMAKGCEMQEARMTS